MKITLHYYSLNRNRFPEPKAVAECEATLTPTQIIVKSGKTANERGIRLGGLPYKFRRKDGRSIPHYSMVNSWEPAPGEIDRIKAETETLRTANAEDYPRSES